MGTDIRKFFIYKFIIYAVFVFLFSTACTSHHNESYKFNTLLSILDSEYIKELNSSKITDNALKKVLSQLDPHSRYLPANALENYLITTNGEYGGIGISMYLNESILTIMHTYPNSPAKKYGIKTGDIILKINKHSTLGLSLDECSKLAKGKIGDVLNLTIVRKSYKKPLLFTIKRKQIETAPLKLKTFKKDILYVKIPIFNTKSTAELANILKKHTRMQGLILDLRSNPGGILDQAVSMVDLFIDKGLIVSQKGRNARHTKNYMASSNTNYTHIGIVILIDSYSASASEIVAGSLKIHKRATIVGEKSLGKGSVQALFSLDEKSAVKLTIAKYYLPNGICIDKIGIEPHIVIKSNNRPSIAYKRPSQKRLEQILEQLNKGTLKTKSSNIEQNKDTKHSKTKIDKSLKKAIQVLRNAHAKP